LQDLTSQQNDLLVQKGRLLEAEAAIAVLAETKTKVAAEYRHKLYVDLAEAEMKASGLNQDAIKAEKRANFQFLTAPVDGVIIPAPRKHANHHADARLPEWNVPRTSDGRAGLVEVNGASPPSTRAPPITSGYVRPNCAFTSASAFSKAARSAGCEKST
jgi:hypothetical protein